MNNMNNMNEFILYEIHIMNMNLLSTWRQAAKIETFILCFWYTVGTRLSGRGRGSHIMGFV